MEKLIGRRIMAKYKYEEKSPRNFEKEAKELISKLKGNQFYEMYKIVSDKLKQYNTEERTNELKAVKNAIENLKDIDTSRLDHIWNGYKSEMAKNAKPKDGAGKACRKRV